MYKKRVDLWWKLHVLLCMSNLHFFVFKAAAIHMQMLDEEQQPVLQL